MSLPQLLSISCPACTSSCPVPTETLDADDLFDLAPVLPMRPQPSLSYTDDISTCPEPYMHTGQLQSPTSLAGRMQAPLRLCLLRCARWYALPTYRPEHQALIWSFLVPETTPVLTMSDCVTLNGIGWQHPEVAEAVYAAVAQAGDLESHMLGMASCVEVARQLALLAFNWSATMCFDVSVISDIASA